MGKYIVGIDQSTQGTKAILVDIEGNIIRRCDISHKQIVSEEGWVSHDPLEIYNNTIKAVKKLIEEAKIDKKDLACVGISNQRETTVAWDRMSGEPLGNAIVWQCSRSKNICDKIEQNGYGDYIREKTGINLSPYFPGSKIAWILQNNPKASQLDAEDRLCHGTIDTWLIFKLTSGKSYKTDYSNASRTQLFNIVDLKWDKKICSMFGINDKNLAEVCDSDSNFGKTDFEGYLDYAIPIHGVLGDSHAALFGQGCLKTGMIKTTYGTGSSIMMNIGDKPILSKNGVVTSLAWGMNGKITYVLEGNINYTGAVITWLKDDVKLLDSPKESEILSYEANKDDSVYFVPAFTGLGAPYWDSDAMACLSGITRTTGKAEIVRAGLESIAYQITDIVKAMAMDSGIEINEIRVDGGPTRNKYLMQFQSDILNMDVQVPDAEELSGIGAAFMAGIGCNIYRKSIFNSINRIKYQPCMKLEVRNKKYMGWLDAVKNTLSK